MRHYLLHILGILIWVMFGAVGVGILWLIDLYTPLSLHLVDSKEALIFKFSRLVHIRSHNDNF